MVLVDDGVARAPILLAADATPSATQAAKELADCIAKISGARPEIISGGLHPAPRAAIWVGRQPGLADRFPGVKFDFDRPEEALYLCDGHSLVIAGRDRMFGGKQLEHGTANALYTFMQRELGVRWLWPGDLGTDFPEARTLSVAPVSYRFAPPIRERKMWRASYGGKMEEDARAWFRFNRMTLGSLECFGGHAYTKWWKDYGEAHPEYFALQSNGTRTPPRAPEDVKLCVSNPGVWKQWLDDAEKAFRADPGLTMVSASPNDGGGFCVCEKCRAWDPPDGPPLWGYVALTDRYVKYWNILARGLRERLPDREAFVGVYAYSAYRTPPVAESLEPNIAVGFVGHFPLSCDELTARDKEIWKAWADKATLMFYRPNLFHYTGGPLGLPSVSPRRAFRDLRFLAGNKCVGLQVDSLPMNWATQGLDYYAMAQFAYDPFQDGEALLKDYCRRGFGPAAGPVEAYFNLLEKAHEELLPQIKHSSGWAREAVAVYQRVWTDEVLNAAAAQLDQAAAATANGPAKYRDRVAFLRSGLDFVRLQLRIMRAMQRVRESSGKDAAAVKEATDLCATREQLYKDAWPTFAFRFSRWYQESRNMADYMGPPSKDLLTAAQRPAVTLAAARWKPAWTEEFDRAVLGPDWRVLEGVWTVENGCLISKGGGRIVSARAFPGLHKVEIEASVTAGVGEVVSDMDPIIHADEKGAGYLMQVGGYYNSRSSIQRLGTTLARGAHAIVPGKVHTITAELNGNALRLTLDGKKLLEYADAAPLLDKEHARIGFYTYQGTVRIERIRVFTSDAVSQHEPLEARE
jgi:hypothetical protein